MSRIDPPQIDEIREAAIRSAGVVVRTPLVAFNDPDNSDRSQDILLKMEIHQAVGSFKIRGIFNAVAHLPEDVRARGLSTVSAGNTAQALAWAGRYFGVPARSIMPENAPATKIRAMRALGGQPVLVPGDEVFRYLKEHRWEDEPYAFIHPWTNRDVMTGHGTMGIEIVEQCPDLERVFVPVGGGGLLAGVGSAIRALRPEVRIIAVEPEQCPALYESRRAGKPVSVECRTICDGVAVPYITDEMFPLLCDLVDESVLVPEANVRKTIRLLVERNQVVAEGAGALAGAAALAMPPAQRGISVALVTGGNIDPARLVEILAERPD